MTVEEAKIIILEDQVLRLEKVVAALVTAFTQGQSIAWNREAVTASDEIVSKIRGREK